ncbi:glycosyltransferase [Actinoplanes sp. NEAU-A12]|uniref:Glycosyltransferase n=1 Tax=Actinoplanes sandaracinus TaxID=3045177 RepID=A0ABT6X088_9ACTN|nr:glycosyltransferase [Actinoplanes sandaracinus]MDI6105399.1 glycosyltransferase [Actinoplanes sandaracinus]
MSPYRVEQVTDRDPPHLPVLFAIFMTLAPVFAVWRTAVVNWDVWYGPVAWAAEMFAVATTVVFVLSLRRRTRPTPRPVASPVTRTVDILVPTVNEPLPVLEPTVLGATRVRGVRDVIVLDDGNRAEIRDMAARLGARYLPRTTSEGAKAGNLNHGLTVTDAEFVVTLDADHIPLPEFIERTLGYFDDPDVAVVQSPQSFYNTESFTFRRRNGADGGWHEQEMFYGGVQPTKNSTNSAIYTGTSAMLRRSALDAVGGFAEDTSTEDIHTSLRLHARGGKSVYLEEPLAYGLEVDNLRQYYGTRRRWAIGSLHLLLRHPDSPLRARGLTLPQRLNYLSAMVAHFQGLNRLLYLLVPVAALTTGVAPVRGPYAVYGFAFLAFTIFSIWTVVQFGRGHYHMLHSEAFAVADTLPMLAALPAALFGERQFGVTEKRARRTTDARLKWAYRVFALVEAGALGFALFRLAQGEHVVIAAWSAAFLALSTGYVLSFLIGMERYERRPVVAWYTHLDPEQLYRRIAAGSERERVLT